MEGISVRQSRLNFEQRLNSNKAFKSSAEINTLNGDTLTTQTESQATTNGTNAPPKSKNKLKSWLIGSGITLAVGAYAAVFYRRNIMNYIDNFIRKSYLKADQIKESAQGHLERIEPTSVKIARFLDKTLMRSQILVNFSAMKDSLSNKIARWLHMGPLCDKLTQTWDRLATKAVTSNYTKCQKSLSKTNDTVLNKLKDIEKNEDLSSIIQVNDKNYTLKEVLDLIRQNMKDANNIYNKNFSLDAFNVRKGILTERLKGLNDKFYEAYTDLNYYKEGQFTRFTVEEWLAPIKASYQNYILNNKTIISNNIDDKFNVTHKLLKNLDKLIAPDDTKTRGVLKNIFNQLKEYRQLSGADEIASRERLNKEIADKLQTISEYVKNNSAYKATTIKEINGAIPNIIKAINMGQKGKLQETLTYLKAILPRNEYIKIRKQMYDTTNKLNKVTNAEGDLYFDKIRDITLGSAFTDIVFGMLTPLATMGIVIAADDTKNDRISTTLKLGIPLIGGIATSTAFLFMLASGGKAMALSTLTGAILNRIGSFADKQIRENQEAKAKNEQLNSIIKNVNTASTFLASGGQSYFIDKATNAGIKKAEQYTNTAISQVNNYLKSNSNIDNSAQVEPQNTP